MDFSQLQWLTFDVEREGIENVLLRLEANNAVGTRLANMLLDPLPSVL